MVLTTINVGDVPTASYMNDYVRDGKQIALAVGRADGTQSIGTNTTTGVKLLGTEDVDTDNIHSNVTNSNTFTPTDPGWYRIVGYVICANSALGTYRQVVVLKNAIADATNSSLGYGFVRANSTSSTAAIALNIMSVPIFCNGTTDNLQLAYGHDTGGNLIITDAAVSVYRYRG